MKKELVRRLLLYIVSHLQDLESPISSIRLIKFLYLIDYEHHLRYGELLTDIEWIRYYYGPYFHEWPSVLKSTRLDLDPREFVVAKSGHKGTTYRASGDHQVEDILNYAAERLVCKVIEHWADTDTQSILDFVYLDTEPMQVSKHGAPLDFTKIRRDFERRRPSKTIKISEEASERIQEMLKAKREKASPVLAQPIYDDAYFDAVAKMDEEDSSNQVRIENIKVPTDSINFNQPNLE